MTSPFHRSRRIGSPFSPGQAVQCVDATGTGLKRSAIYRVEKVNECLACGGGVRLTSGPRPTDVPCGWWRARRFRPLKPPMDELTERIRRAARQGRPAPAPKAPARELEDA
jgi:hypothetical protein